MQLFNATDLFTNDPVRLNQNVDEIEGGRLFMNPPEFEYYINLGGGGVDPSCTPSSTVTDIVYNSPQYNGNQVAFVTWNNTTPAQIAQEFCDLQFEPYVSHSLNSQQSSGNRAIRNYNNTQWETNSRGAPFDTITCGEIETIICNELPDLNIPNNKQLYHQLYDIKMLLLFFFLWYATISSYRIIRNVFTSNIVENDAKKNT